MPRRRTCCSPDPLTGQPLQLNFKTQTYDVEVGDAFRAGTRQVFSVRRQRPPQQLRHHHRPGRREPHRARRLRAGRDLRRHASASRVGGRVDKFGNLERSGVLAAAGGGVQAGERPRAPRLVQPRVPLAVGDQQLPRHRDREPDRSERRSRRSCRRRCGRWSRSRFRSCQAVGSRLPIGDDAAGGADGRIAHRVRGRLHRHVRRAARRSAWRSTSTIATTTSTSSSCRTTSIPTPPPTRRRAGRCRRRSSRCWRSAASSCRGRRSPT